MTDRTESAFLSYSRGAIWLHWTIGLLVILNIALVFVSEGISEPYGRTVMGLHKAIGITVLFLSIARLGWRITHRPPPMPATVAMWEKGLAHLVHWLFYALIILIPLSGWLWMSSSLTPRPISFFGLFDVPFLPVSASKARGDFLHEAHEIMGLAMIGLIVLHVAGALKHHVLEGNAFLGRMIPAFRPR